MNILREILLVGFGGMLGALARYGIAIGSSRFFHDSLPIGTLIANLTGCFLIGMLIGSDLAESQPKIKLLFGVGFLGSLTTFSTFSAETIQNATQGNWTIASANIIANLIFGFAAVLLGIALAKKLFN